MDRGGEFEEFWRRGLLKYDELTGIDWEELAPDGAIGKAPLGGEETGANSTDRAKRGEKSVLSDAPGIPLGIVQAGALRPDEKP